MRGCDLIFVSGQASVEPTGQIVSDTFAGEFRRSVDNMRRVLDSAGSDLRHVVRRETTCAIPPIFLAAIARWPARIKVSDRLGSPYPKRAEAGKVMGSKHDERQ